MHVGQRADAVDADSEAYHIELVLREALYAGGVKHVHKRLVANGFGQPFGTLAEEIDLPQREFVFRRILGHGKVRIHGAHPHFVVGRKELRERRQLLRHEAETVHSGVEFYVHGEALYAALPKLGAQGFQRVEVGDAGLETVVYYFREEVGARRQHEHGQGHAGTAQLHALDGQGHGEVVGAFFLHHRCEFHGSVPVGVGFHEHEQFSGWPQQRTEVTVVTPCRRQAQFQT